jgi:guanyl-specific ribonuclease Sa
MFELNGEQYSLDQVEEAAKQSNLSLDDYIKEYSIIKLDEEGKTNGVAETGATVTPEAGQAPESMELESVDTSLESQQIDNSQEAILKRRKLNALEEAAIMQQPVELDEVVVTADAPKPFSYWKDLVLSPEYEEAFEQIQKDTGEFSSTKDQGFFGLFRSVR